LLGGAGIRSYLARQQHPVERPKDPEIAAIHTQQDFYRHTP
jgi:hypothetical protein